VHIKEYSKTGKRHKFSMHVRVSYPGGTVASSRSHDWDARRALHKSFKDIENRLIHRFKKNIREIPSIRKIII
jgi:hypothetical protein